MEAVKLPGLVDLHVHLRDPGQTHKEDFFTGTSAALAGGYTQVFDMPNNAEPITTLAALETKIASAQKQIVCDVGFHFGSLGDNLDEFAKVRDQVMGLKLYLNVTTGNYLLDPDYLRKIFTAWKSPQPILLHAEADIIKTALAVTAKTNQPTHVCHVSSRDELLPIIEAKDVGLPVTCGVTPHHLFMTEADEKRLGGYAQMKPALKSEADVDFLWEHFDQIDVVESDHAPHTREEKDVGTFGVPGLETSLPLMLQAEKEGRLSRADLIAKCHTNPLAIVNLKPDKTSYSQVRLEEYELTEENLKTKCGWTPFVGRHVRGRVIETYLYGEKVFANGEVLAQPGSGQIVRPRLSS